MNRMEFMTVSARHGLRTDLLLVSVLVMSTASTASLRSLCAPYGVVWVLEIAEWHAWSRAG